MRSIACHPRVNEGFMKLFFEETGFSCNNIKLAVLSHEVFGGYVLQELAILLAKKTNKHTLKNTDP